jgi:multisubunit Na+/H+ antiporter MnhB subunit
MVMMMLVVVVMVVVLLLMIFLLLNRAPEFLLWMSYRAYLSVHGMGFHVVHASLKSSRADQPWFGRI